MSLKETDPELYSLVEMEERKLTRPENYRKKSTPRLIRSLRRIEENLAMASGNWGPVGVPLRKLFRDHRGKALAELKRRTAKRKAA